MRVLVTGGAGFIGSHFVKRLLARGDEVVVLDALRYSSNLANLPAGIDNLPADIANAEAVRGAADGCDAIVNFAAETHVDRSILIAAEFAKTEIDGTRTLLEVVRELGIRLVQVSTDEVYGDLAAGGSSVETDPVAPSSPYSWAKAASDLMIPAWVRTYGVDALLTRGSNTYGPNQYPEKLIPLFITNALDGEPLPLYGDGRQVRDWLWVEDHCAGIELVLDGGVAGEAYNVGAGDERQNVEIADRIVGLTGADASSHPPRLGPARARPALLARQRQAPQRAQLGASEELRGRARRDGRLVPRQPRVVGADQVRRALQRPTTSGSTRHASGAEADLRVP